MWICPNCETANNSRKRKCAVCDSEKPFSNENPNSPSILKSKIQELEEQILILNEEQISLNQSKTGIIVALIIALVVSVVTCSTKNGETVVDTSKFSELENKLQVISSEVPFVVTSIDFENSAERNNYKRNFNYNSVRYISPRLKIIPIANSWSGKISVKYFSPSGVLDRNPSISPIGFTFDYETNTYSTQEYINLSGWGSDSGSTYEVGTHTAEIWYNGKIIGKQTFTVSY